MNVQLTTDVPKLGRQGEITSVSDAYARNFLFARRLAIPATAGIVAEHKRRIAQQQAKRHQDETEVAAAVQRLEGVTLRLTERASPQGKLFAAIKADRIQAALEQQYHVRLPRFSCDPDHIKVAGERALTATVGDHLHFSFTLVVDHG